MHEKANLLMESMRIWKITLLVFYVFLFQYVQGMNNYSSDSLDSYIHDYAIKKMAKPSRTGTLYNITLPSNFSGIDVSIVRIRTNSLWIRGESINFFEIPTRILPVPFAKRVDFVYQNLGNWSNYFYSVPNHTLIAPVLGLIAYDSNSTVEEGGMIGLSIMGDPIRVHFPQISKPGEENVTIKCVMFGLNGVVEFSDFNETNTCMAKDQGHFSVVIPSPSTSGRIKKKKARRWKWWAIGFGAGFAGLALLVVLMLCVYKVIRVNRIAKMEKQSEKSENLDEVWIGRSRMPSATGIRTQPVLENSYVP